MATNNLGVKFLRGQAANLSSAPITDGYLYLTTDTHKLYADIGTERALLNHDIDFVDNLSDLNVETSNKDQLFYVRNTNVLAIFNGTDFVQINPETGVKSVAVSGKGPAITGVSYADGVLTLTRGSIYAKDIKLGNGIEGEGGDDGSIIVTADVGNYAKGSVVKKDNIAALIADMLSADIPASKTNPSFKSITLTNAGSYEVGTTITPSYTTDISAGSYSKTRDPESGRDVSQATNVSFNSWAVTEIGRPGVAEADREVNDSSAGSFDSLEVVDGLNYYLSATCKSTAGSVPKTYLGKSDTAHQITEMSHGPKITSTITSYRSWFVGGTTLADLNSSTIRGLTPKYNDYNSFDLQASSYPNCTKIIVAIPKAKGKVLSKVYLKSSSNADITNEFKEKDEVDVKGASATSTSVKYRVWVYEPASLDSTEVYTITLA